MHTCPRRYPAAVENARNSAADEDFRNDSGSLGGSDVETIIERDFIAYDANYLGRKTEFGQPLHDLARRLAA